MPLLIGHIGLKTAAPLVGLVAIVLQTLSILLYGLKIDVKQIRWLIIGGLMAVPIGVSLIDWVNEAILKLILGIVLLIYVAFRLLKKEEFQPIPKRLGFFFGFLGGLLGGVFNASGPPVVVYANSQRWEPDVFRINMQTYFLFNGAIGIFSHFAAGNYTGDVLYYILIAVPILIGGTFFGRWLAKFIDPNLFQYMVLILLLFLGIRLIMTA
jgi:uncharacterized membrane protein YfcA